MIRREDGMTLIEVMVTVLVISLGTLATLGSFTGFSASARDSQVRAVLVSVAQQQLEQLRPTPYAQLALESSPSPQAAAEAPLGGPASAEPLATGGTVRPGADAFTYQGVSGRIYRYVTWRAQSCPAVTTKVQSQLANDLGTTSASISASLPDLCPSGARTKRVSVAVVPLVRGRPGTPVWLSTIVGDPASATPVLATAGLKLQPVVQAVAGGATAPVPTTVQQAFQLTDTRCEASVRGSTSDHAARNSAQAGSACAAGVPGRPDLMTLEPVPGTATDPLRDFASDVTRAAPGGIALVRDDRAGGCTETANLDYASADADRRHYSLHSWATPPASAAFSTAASGGRGVLSVWTRTADGAAHPGRLCAVVRRVSTGEVLGSADFALERWPAEPTELSVGFDLAAKALAAGERLQLTLRVPADSGSDLTVLYDHPAYQSRLTLTTAPGGEFR